MNKRIVALFPIALLISSCAALKGRDYVPPETGVTAKFKVGSEVETDLLTTFTYEDSKACTKRFAIRNPTKYFNVPAEKEFAITHYILFINGNDYCFNTVAVTPKKGKYYVLNNIYNREDQKCYVSVQEGETAEGPFESIRVKKLVDEAGFDENSSFCSQPKETEQL